MRCWHKDLIPYLPDLQLKGQWRECALIADALAKNGTPNHLLVNRVTEYAPSSFGSYCFTVKCEMEKRGFEVKDGSYMNILDKLLTWKETIPSSKKFAPFYDTVFDGWHNREYLRICYANLLEKHNGIGKSRITDEEWQRLCEGYKTITGEEYKI